MNKELTSDIIKQLEVARAAMEYADNIARNKSRKPDAVWDHMIKVFKRVMKDQGYTDEQIKNLMDYDELYNEDPLIVLTPETDAVFRDIIRDV
jgi:hypothetical protein